MTLLFSNFQRYTPHFPNPKNRSKRGPTVLPFIFQGSVPLPAFSIQNLKKAMKMTWLHMEFVLIFITPCVQPSTMADLPAEVFAATRPCWCNMNISRNLKPNSL